MPILRNKNTGETRQYPSRYQLMGLGLPNADDWSWLDDLQTAQTEATAAANNTYAALIRELTGGSTAEERDTWPVQLPIAQSIVAGAVLDADDALLADSILKPGETRVVWAAKVVGKNRAVKRLIGTANHILRTTLDAIDVSETADAVQDVMTNAKASADAAQAAFLQG